MWPLHAHGAGLLALRVSLALHTEQPEQSPHLSADGATAARTSSLGREASVGMGTWAPLATESQNLASSSVAATEVDRKSVV